MFHSDEIHEPAFCFARTATVTSEQHMPILQESVYRSGFVPLSVSVSHSLCLTHTRARTHPSTHARPNTPTPTPTPHTHARTRTHTRVLQQQRREEPMVRRTVSQSLNVVTTHDISEATTTVKRHTSTINVVTSSFQEQAVSS